MTEKGRIKILRFIANRFTMVKQYISSCIRITLSLHWTANHTFTPNLQITQK